MREGGTVETKIMPEPHNQYDSKAIAICCKVNSLGPKFAFTQ